MSANPTTPGYVPLRLSDDLPEVGFQPRDYVMTGETVDSDTVARFLDDASNRSSTVSTESRCSYSAEIGRLLATALEIVTRSHSTNGSLQPIDRVILASAAEASRELGEAIAQVLQREAVRNKSTKKPNRKKSTRN